MSVWGDAIAGLSTVLVANVTVPRVPKIYTTLPDSVNQYPSIVLLPEPFDPRMVFGGNSFDGAIRGIVHVAKAVSGEAFDEIYKYISPTETNQSIQAAVNADRTLNGKVDDAQVSSIENIGRVNQQGGFFAEFEFVVEFQKTGI